MEHQNGKSAPDLFIARLRDQTAASHLALEETRLSKALLNDNLYLDDYRAYLSKMYGIIKGFELSVWPRLKNYFIEGPSREKAHLLEQDLRAIGLSESELAALPLKTFSAATAAEAWGIFYVLEGSTLGGRLLLKHIQKLLPELEGRGMLFFSGYNEQTGIMWKGFVHAFADYAVQNSKETDVIRAAVKCFEEIKEWFEDRY